jgi:hypothetical protein
MDVVGPIGAIIGAAIPHSPLTSIARLCLQQHLQMLEERNDSCSSGVILARAAILVLGLGKK